MTPTELSTGIQTVSTTGAITPTAGIDISGVTGPATVCFEVISMTAAKTARVQLEDTVDSFTTAVALHVFHVIGQEGQGGTSYTAGAYNPTTEKQSVQKYQLRNSEFGVGSGKLRLNVTAIDASSSLSLHAWVEK